MCRRLGVVASRRNRERLREIETYIAEESPQSAKEVVARLLRRSQQLTRLPSNGRWVPEYPEADLRELLERPFRIIYRVAVDQVEVVTVFHYRQVLPTDLETLSKR